MLNVEVLWAENGPTDLHTALVLKPVFGPATTIHKNFLHPRHEFLTSFMAIDGD